MGRARADDDDAATATSGGTAAAPRRRKTTGGAAASAVRPIDRAEEEVVVAKSDTTSSGRCMVGRQCTHRTSAKGETANFSVDFPRRCAVSVFSAPEVTRRELNVKVSITWDGAIYFVVQTSNRHPHNILRMAPALACTRI